MAGYGSDFERQQIESVLQPDPTPIERDSGLFLMPQIESLERVYQAAVAPALRDNGIGDASMTRVFGSESPLAEVIRQVQSAEVIIADVSWVNADLMYVLGLCHGLHRCPVLISHDPENLPFNLSLLRCIEYRDGSRGLWHLRRNLTRAVRVFLASVRSEPPQE